MSWSDHWRDTQPTPEGRQIADAFKKLRSEAGMTQEDVARKIDMTLSGYRPYEQGRRQLRTEQIPMFARAFRVSVEHLSASLGLSTAATHDIRIAECADILGQLEGEPPEVADTILRWLRESVEIARMSRLGRTN